MADKQNPDKWRSKQANPTLIGLFVVIAMGVTVGGILFFNQASLFQERQHFVLFFEDSISGLDVGAPVEFRGVRVGTVSQIRVVADYQAQTFDIPVIIQLEPDRISSPPAKKTPEAVAIETIMDQHVKKGLRAQLGAQSLVTGKLKVNLNYFPDTPVRRVGKYLLYPELPTIPSPLARVLKQMEELPVAEIVMETHQAMQGLAKLVNSDRVQHILANLEATIQKTGELVEDLQGHVDPGARELALLTEDARQTLADIRELTAAIHTEIEPLAGDLRKQAAKATDSLDETLGEVRQLAATVNKKINPLLDNLGAISDRVDGLLGEDSPVSFQVSQALDDLSAAARSLQALTDYLERHPEAIVRGKRRGD